MIKEKKYPIELIDGDSAPHLVAPDAAVNMANIRLTSGRNKDIGYFRNIRSNRKLTDANNIPANSKCVGGAISPNGKYIVWLTQCVGNADFDQINYFDVTTGEYWLVMRSNMDSIGKVLGGLNFGKYVHSIQLIDDVLYWTDNSEEPRKLHIGAAIRASHPTLNETPLYPGWQYSWTNLPYAYVDKSALTLICKPPAYPPTIIKEVDPDSDNNYISNESFQFATQYIYYIGERSTLSMFSESSLINRKDEKSNVIVVYLRQDDIPVPSAVRRIRLIVKIKSTSRCFEVKVWDKEIPQDLQEISDFATGGPLIYRFYFNYLGEIIDDVTASKPFENVPILTETLAFCKNRLFAANNREGYDTPKVFSSLQLRIGDGEEATFTTIRCYSCAFRWSNGSTTVYRKSWLVYLTTDFPDVAQDGYYEIDSTVINVNDGLNFSDIPATIDDDDITFRGTTVDEIEASVRPGGYNLSYKTLRYDPRGHTKYGTGETITSHVSLLYNNEVHAGVVFYDKYLRKCGVVLPYNYYEGVVPQGEWGGRVGLPIRNYNITTVYPYADWKLLNDNAVNEIPVEAFYYSVVQKDKDRIGYFVSAWSRQPKYVKLGTGGDFEYEDTFDDVDTIGVAVETSSLVQAGLGYTFSEGDMCILVRTDNEKWVLPVTGQNAKYIHLATENIGDLTSFANVFIYEIFTPIRSNNQQFFFEIGQLYAVSNPGTDQRSYSVTEGQIKADTYVLRRNYDGNTYRAQAMSHNDIYYKIWVTHFGRINAITLLGQGQKKTNVRFSNTWIPGSFNNGLSSFETLNEESLAVELGAVKKLITTTKIQGDGDIVVAICENGVVSLYIDESQLYDQNSTPYVVKSDKVIGSTNVLRGDYGTRHPESVAENNGNVFWFDKNHASYLKYSANGLFAVSDVKLKFAALALAQKLTEDDLVLGGIDPYNGEYLSQPLIAEGDGDQFRFDMLGNKTIVFVISENKCRGNDHYVTEGIVSAGTDTYAFKEGHLWKQEDGNGYNNFFGVQVPSRISVLANRNAIGSDEQVAMSRFLSVAVEATKAPDLTSFKTEYPNMQLSDLVANEYVNREGVYYAAVLRDRLSPNTPGTEFDKMYIGDPMVGPYMFCEMMWNGNTELRLKAITIGYKNRDGHE